MAEPALPLARSSARRLAAVAALVAALGTAACSPADVAVRAGVSAGFAAVQERSIEDAVRDVAIKTGIVEEYFQTHIDELFRPVNVDVMEGRVLLTGIVADRGRADEAAEIAWRVDGVRRVINEIRIGDLSLVDATRDRRVAAELRARLIADGAVRDFNFAIAVVDGSVHVLGIAQDARERDRVAAHARDMDYVRGATMHVLLRDDPLRVANPP